MNDDAPKGAKPLPSAESWYAVWTHSHCERLVAQQLAARGFAPFLPEVRTRAARAARTRFVPAPLFPGYLFVREAMTKTRYLEILNVRGLVRVLEDGWTRLTPVPDSEIESIRRVIDAGLPVFAHAHLREGDRVRVVDGPLSGVEGLFVTDGQRKGRLVLSVDLLGRSVAVDVSAEDVIRCQ